MSLVLPKYSLGEELANAITHGIGALLGVIGCVLLLQRSHDPVQIASAAIYGGTLVLMFLMSCLYHAIAAPRLKYVFRIFDHSSVALLIAGTYTPYTLLTLRGALGWAILAVVWLCTVLTIVFSAVNMEKFKRATMFCYVASGWCILPAFVPLIRSLDTTGFLLLLAGGIAYTVGIVFYKLKTVPYMHTLWHVFVLAGAVLQYLSLYFYVFN